MPSPRAAPANKPPTRSRKAETIRARNNKSSVPRSLQNTFCAMAARTQRSALASGWSSAAARVRAACTKTDSAARTHQVTSAAASISAGRLVVASIRSRFRPRRMTKGRRNMRAISARTISVGLRMRSRGTRESYGASAIGARLRSTRRIRGPFGGLFTSERTPGKDLLRVSFAPVFRAYHRSSTR
jgi:hypothetical protein